MAPKGDGKTRGPGEGGAGIYWFKGHSAGCMFAQLEKDRGRGHGATAVDADRGLLVNAKVTRKKR